MVKEWLDLSNDVSVWILWFDMEFRGVCGKWVIMLMQKHAKVLMLKIFQPKFSIFRPNFHRQLAMNANLQAAALSAVLLVLTTVSIEVLVWALAQCPLPDAILTWLQRFADVVDTAPRPAASSSKKRKTSSSILDNKGEAGPLLVRGAFG
jgi:hypothetical protein